MIQHALPPTRYVRLAIVAVLIFFTLSGRNTLHAQTLSAADKGIYKSAFAAAKANQWDKARKLAAKARDPHLADVLAWMDLRRDDSTAGFAELSQFVEAHGDWPGISNLRARAEIALPDDTDATAVLAWYGKRAPVTLVGASKLTRAHLALNHAAEATATMQRAWRTLDGTEEQTASFAAEFKTLLTDADHIDRADRLLWQDKIGLARAMLSLLPAPHRALADARLALINNMAGVEGIIAKVPTELRSDLGLVYDRIRWRRRNNSEANIVDILPKAPVVITYPDQWWKEIESAARRRLVQGDPADAYLLAAQYRPSDGRNYADGEWLAGWIALRFMDNPKAAYQHFQNMYGKVSSPISRARGAYWAGRAAEAVSDQTNATQWYRTAATYPTTFYGQIAALTQAPYHVTLPVAPAINAATKKTFDKAPLTIVTRQLIEIGEADRALPFLDVMMDRAQTPEQARLIVALAAESKQHDITVMTAKDARLKGIELVDELYPLRTLPAGGTADPALVLAIIRQESVFAPDAVSGAGARGMMQLMPATAKGVAKKLKLPYSAGKLTSDPNYNIKLGRAYLEGLLADFDGSVILAAASYNAGPSRARTWMTLFGDPRLATTDAIDWIEMIPFSETRNYVQRVVENMIVYHHRLKQPKRAQSALQQIARLPAAASQ